MATKAETALEQRAKDLRDELGYVPLSPQFANVEHSKNGSKHIAFLRVGTQAIMGQAASRIGALRALVAKLETEKADRWTPATRANPSRAPRLTWVPFSIALRRTLDGRSGAYAIRRRDSKRVIYVGESTHGALYKTLARHFYLPASKGASFATDRPGDYEVAWKVTSTGVRSKKSGKPADQAALNLQAKWIEALNPEKNVNDGLAEPYEPLGESEDAWGGLLNPGGELQVLGKLVGLEGKGAKYTWPERSAPLLGYDKNGRLYIVYNGRVVGPSTSAQQREYRRAHWGLDGEGKLRDGGIAVAPFTTGIVSTRIRYATSKGSDGTEIVHYVHEWGEGGPRQWKAPLIVQHSCARCGPRCNARGSLALHGGTYKVNERGIVG